MTYGPQTTIDALIRDGDLIVSDGYRTKVSEHGIPGFRIIRVADVADDSISVTSPDFVSIEYEKVIGSKIGREGDVLLTTKGTVGRVAVLPRLEERVVYSPQLCFFRVIDQTCLNPRYLRYWFSSPEFKHQASHRMNNTDMAAYINLKDIRSLRITLPSEPDQRAIVAVLGALDDKVAANAVLMGSLKRHLSLELELAVGPGCAPIRLGDIVVFHNRRRVPLSARERDQRPGSVPYYGATGQFGFVDQAIFDEVLVLVGEDGSVATEDGHPVVQYIWGPAWVNNHAHVLTGLGVSSELLLLLLERADVRTLVTGAVQPKLSMGNLRSLGVQVPHGDGLERIERLCAAEMATFRSLSKESVYLTSMRELLLPSLISGKLRVKDAEKQVEAVV